MNMRHLFAVLVFCLSTSSAFGLADLLPTNISVSPDPATAGGSVTVSYRVTNQGNTAAPASHTKVQIKNASNVLLIQTTFTTNAVGASSFVSESRSMSLVGAVAGTTYFAYVIVDNNFEVTQSNTVNDLSTGTPFAVVGAIPPAPTNLVVVGTTGSVLLQWNDNATNETGFRIERKTGSGGTWGLLTTAGAFSGTNPDAYADTSVTNGTSYYYRVSATNAAGTSTSTNERGGTALAVPTTAFPTNGSTVTSSSVTLNWSGITGATTYGIDMGNSCGATGTLSNQASSGNSYTISLSNGTYYWRVRAANTSSSAPGASTVSGCASFTVSLPPPAAPSALQAVGSSNTVLLGWTDNASNESGFRIERKLGANGTWTLLSTIVPAVSNTGGTTAYQDTGLSFGNVYYYRVYAYNGSGNSGYSSEQAATTLDAPVPSYPLDGATVSSGSLTLQWGSVVAATGYGVEWLDSCGSNPNVMSSQDTVQPSLPVNLTSGVYYWRVRAKGLVPALGLSNPSACRTFTVNAGCSATLGNPLANTSLLFPQTFDWTVSGNCSSQCLGFATSANPSSTQVHFTTQPSGVSISQSFWNNVRGFIGNAPTYYWAVGECSGNTFTAHSTWRPFTINTMCAASLTSPAVNASFTFPQTFTWTVSGTCSSQCLGFATSANPSTIYATAGWTSGGQVTQTVWNNVLNTIGNATTYYWTVGECTNGSNFVARDNWRPFTIYATAKCCTAGSMCSPGVMTQSQCSALGGIWQVPGSATCTNCTAPPATVATYIYVPIHGQLIETMCPAWLCTGTPVQPPWMANSDYLLNQAFNNPVPHPGGSGIATRDKVIGDWVEGTRDGLPEILTSRFLYISGSLAPLAQIAAAAAEYSGRKASSKASAAAANAIYQEVRLKIMAVPGVNVPVFVDLVGHSRGGAVAAAVLHKLQGDQSLGHPVYYSLTLLDAIDPDGGPHFQLFETAGDLLGDPVIGTDIQERRTNYVAEYACCGFFPEPFDTWFTTHAQLATTTGFAAIGYPHGKIRPVSVTPSHTQQLPGQVVSGTPPTTHINIQTKFAMTAGSYSTIPPPEFSFAFATRIGELLLSPNQPLPPLLMQRCPNCPFGPRDPPVTEYVSDPTFMLACATITSVQAALATPQIAAMLTPDVGQVQAIMSNIAGSNWVADSSWKRTADTATCITNAAVVPANETIWQYLDPASLIQPRVRLRVQGTVDAGGSALVRLTGDGFAFSQPVVPGVGGSFSMDQVIPRTPQVGSGVLDSISVTGGSVHVTLVSVGPADGACCATGSCSLTIQSTCATTWTPGGSCTPNPCAIGQCCSGSDACSVSLQAACPGVWTNGGSCTPIACICSNSPTNVTIPQQLVRPNPQTGDQYGFAVAADSTTIIVGARYAASTAGTGTGAAYIYQRGPNGVWTTTPQQLSPLPQNDAGQPVQQWFGNNVAVSGDLMLVAARHATSSSQPTAGVVYAYRRDAGGVWQYIQTLAAPSPSNNAEFGHSVGLDGTYAIVGCVRPTSSPGGAAYVFHFDGMMWALDTGGTLVAPDATPNRLFGLNSSISGDTAIVGANSYAPTDVGAAYIFRRGASGWVFEQQLQPTFPHAGEAFGEVVKVNGNQAIVAATYDTHNGLAQAGAAYIFTRTGTVWTQEATLIPSDTQAFGHFGFYSDLNGQYATIGSFGFGTPGTAYVFKRTAAGWRQSDKFTSPTPAADGRFGYGVAISDTTVPGAFMVVAGYGQSVGAVANTGSAAVFDLRGLDSNDNGIPDYCDIQQGTLPDVNLDGIPDGYRTAVYCPADFNHSGTLSAQDIFDYLTAWFAGDTRADFNGGGLSAQDIFDFLAAWFAGC